MIGNLMLATIQHSINIFDFTVSSAHEAFRNDNIIASRVSSKSSTILANNVHIVEKLSLNSFQDKDIHVQVALVYICIL